MKSTTYPVHVAETAGRPGLFAAEPFEEGAVVEKLEGRVVRYDKIPNEQLQYAFEIDTNRWVAPQNHAKHINHSCDPNCYLNENLEVIAKRRIAGGDEITISYNEVTLDEFMRSGAILPHWDQRRSFKCRCGSRKCAGTIDRYVVSIPDDPNSKKVKVGVVESRGRAMFATKSILKGEVIERAPVIVLPGKQWKDIEDTALIDYAFDWGEEGKESAIALGYISVYNHSYAPNAHLEELSDELMMEVVARRDIRPGEEITINYNGDPENQDALWFTERQG